MLQGNNFWRVWSSSVAIETQQYYIFCIVVELLVSLSTMQPEITSSCKLPDFLSDFNQTGMSWTHFSITLVNNQLDAQIFNTFITVLYMYMFRAISCSSSGGQIVLTL